MSDDRSLELFDSVYWFVALNPNQAYLGRSVVVLKRPCSDLSDLQPEEWSDLHGVIKRTQRVIRAALGATMFNWACSMNHAYRESPPKAQVHWHAIPRYELPVRIGTLDYADPNFGERSLTISSTLQTEHREMVLVALRNAVATIK